MSQHVSQPSWKQEVNRRLEAHKSRKGSSAAEDAAQCDERSNVSDVAAQAAARVAARFSKAPSYGEMQAAEARAALRNAEAATRAALEAQAVAQAALANLERLSECSLAYEEQTETASTSCDSSGWEREGEAAPISALPTMADWQAARLTTSPALKQEPAPKSTRKLSTEGTSLSPISHSDDLAEGTPGEWVEPAKPIHANLIQFPRELVATRRIRPRIAEGTQSKAEEQNGQLSIFEVDPKSISTEPVASASVETSVQASPWSGLDWQSVELESGFDDDREPIPEYLSLAPAIHLAPLSLRAMAATIDLALVIAMACAAALGIAGHMTHGSSMKTAEIGAFTAFLLIAIFYQSFFLLTTMSTPGMMYAGISLCTFDDEFPTRKQLRDRIGALLISFLPMGLGIAWSIFDEDRLSWHDRLSQTYQRRC